VDINLTPDNGNGFDVVLHWDGAGWYAPRQEGGMVHEYPVPGFDESGFSENDEERVWDVTRGMGLGTAHWLNSVTGYSGYIRA